MLPILYHRHGLGQFLCGLNLLGHGVEVGCAFGGFSERILEQWPGTLHLVDPWIKQPATVYRESTNDTAPWEDWFTYAKQAVSRFGNRAQLHQMYSNEAAPTFPDGSLDFVYLDGNHSFEAVTEDLALWFPKVKTGGLISGHDYYDSDKDGHFCFAKSAVDAWMKQNPAYQLSLTVGGCSSWYFIK